MNKIDLRRICQEHMPDVVYRFGDFQLDCGRVERKPMKLLILLASREGQLVTRAEIAQRLWPGRPVL